MSVGKHCHLTSSRSTFYKTFLDKERFIDFLDSARILTDGSGYRSQANWTSAKFINDSAQQFVVNLVKAVSVYIEGFECIPGYFRIYFP